MDLKKLKIKNILLVILAIGALYIGFTSFNTGTEDEVADIGVSEDNELLKYFRESYPDYEVLKAGEEDVDANGFKDLVVIYNISRDKLGYPTKNEMLVILNNNGVYEMTQSTRAPIEKHVIQFQNIENDDRYEITVSGSKRGQYGFGIYEIKDNALVNIYGEEMEKC